jgi:hypothetical protein
MKNKRETSVDVLLQAGAAGSVKRSMEIMSIPLNVSFRDHVQRKQRLDYESPIGISTAWNTCSKKLRAMRARICAVLSWRQSCPVRSKLVLADWPVTSLPHILCGLNLNPERILSCTACFRECPEEPKEVCLSELVQKVAPDHPAVVMALMQQLAGNPSPTNSWKNVRMRM